MMTTLVKGPVPNWPWTRGKHQHFQSRSAENLQDLVRDGVAITTSCFCWSFLSLWKPTITSTPLPLLRLASRRWQRSIFVPPPPLPSQTHDHPLPKPTLAQRRRYLPSSPPMPSSSLKPSSFTAPSSPPRRPRMSISSPDQICLPPLS
ncbi:hypothetical protein L484_025402 [Morus notabilis]|uniref:Uncharacterized protein n=1 Tax=Morus notabilis TaxID=981085 RepID=W9RQT1_9ROSA|nr:hypothetical protein L484_025402 [Morus notabilis]